MRLSVIALSLFGAVPVQQTQQLPALTEAAEDEIVVTGYPPRCRARPDDPLDVATLGAPATGWHYIVEDPLGGYQYVRDKGHGAVGYTTFSRWRRAGQGLSSFVFRQPADRMPMCIGRRPGSPGGTVHLQQELDPTPYRCRTVRLTMFVATRQARAWLWLNNAARKPILVPVEGNHGWTPVSLEWGPVGAGSPWLSFGAILQNGDIWLYQPKLEVLRDDQVSSRLQRQQAACRTEAMRLQQRETWQAGVVAKEREDARHK